MATLKCRLHKKNKSNLYDIIHMETEASLVTTSTGMSIEEVLQHLLDDVATTTGLHALRHSKNGSDPITPESIGAVNELTISEMNAAIEAAKKRIQDMINGAIEVIDDEPYQVGTLTYNGTEQTPVWGNYDDSKAEISGETAGTNAGTYTVTFTVKKGFMWEDGSIEKTVTWSIGRATIAAMPAQSGSLTYSGSEQSPNWSGYNATQLVMSGVIAGTDAGSYVAKFTPTENYMWPDGSVGEKNVTWAIGKAAGSISLSKNSVSFTSAGGSQQITVTRNSTGAISASSNNTSVSTCSVSGDVVTVSNGSANGNCTITVDVAADNNHYAVSTTISVTRNVFAVPTTVGSIFTWAGYEWVVVQVESDRIYAALNTIYTTCQFSANHSYTYANSALFNTVVKAFENSIPSADLANALDTEVNGVTAKIFVPSVNQLRTGFSYLTSNAARIAYYYGVATAWWTSSPQLSEYVFYVAIDGSIGYDSPTQTYGFRPFVALKRS